MIQGGYVVNPSDVMGGLGAASRQYSYVLDWDRVLIVFVEGGIVWQGVVC